MDSPSGLHVVPEMYGGRSQSRIGGPPFTEIFLSFPATLAKPIVLLSGDQKTVFAPSVLSSIRGCCRSTPGSRLCGFSRRR